MLLEENIIEFSTVELYSHNVYHSVFGTVNPPSTSKYKTKSLNESCSKDKDNQQLAVGGLSVTGCLSDFSLYIFHPYGAAKKTGNDHIIHESVVVSVLVWNSPFP